MVDKIMEIGLVGVQNELQQKMESAESNVKKIW